MLLIGDNVAGNYPRHELRLLGPDNKLVSNLSIRYARVNEMCLPHHTG